MDNMEILTVISYGENEGESYRVTLSPSMIMMVCIPEKMVQRQGMTLFKAQVVFSEEGSAELYINSRDVQILEKATGLFFAD